MRSYRLDPPIPAPSTTVPDPTYRAVLGEAAWWRLAADVRRRFSEKPAPGAVRRYEGAMRVVRRSRVGWLLAQVFRLIGTPLAPHDGADVPMTVTLRSVDRGILWERRYRFAGRAPVVARSVKERAPDGGLVERVGFGLGMRLALAEWGGALHFTSTAYFWRLGRMTLPLPPWLTPGRIHVVHADEGGGRFRFTIAVDHPLFGETFFQDGSFEEVP